MSEENTENTQTAAAELSVNDLAVMVNVIDACSKRGAFKPAEMETVGALYTKVVNFLVATGAIKVDDEPTTETDSDAEEEASGEE